MRQLYSDHLVKNLAFQEWLENISLGNYALDGGWPIEESLKMEVLFLKEKFYLEIVFFELISSCCSDVSCDAEKRVQVRLKIPEQFVRGENKRKK